MLEEIQDAVLKSKRSNNRSIIYSDFIESDPEGSSRELPNESTFNKNGVGKPALQPSMSHGFGL